MSEPFLPGYDAWRLRTPPEYEPEGEGEGDGPDPDAQREEYLDRQEGGGR